MSKLRDEVVAEAKKKSHNKLAGEIAEALFTNGAGAKASRLVLVKDNGPPTNVIAAHQNLGGYCKSAVRDIIADALNARKR